MSYPIDKSFSILLALANEPAAGSKIGKQISADTLTENYVSKSGLYLLINKLAREKLIIPDKQTGAALSSGIAPCVTEFLDDAR